MKKSQVNLTQLREQAMQALAQGEAGLASDDAWSQKLSFGHLLEELRVYQAELEIQNEELAQAQSQTSLAMERYRRLFDHLPLPALVVDSAGFIQELNHEARGQLGLSPSTPRNRGALLQLFDLDSRGPLHHYFREPPQVEPRILAFLWVRRPGSPSYPYDLHLMPLNPTALERGPTLAVLVDRGDELALRDSEERWRELSRECQIAQQEAESANLAKSAFLAAMGHEFRTPMNSILGLTDLLLTRDPTPDQSNYLRKIHHAAKALQGLLNGILDYARIETNLMVIESLPVSFKDLFASSWHLFQQQASDKHLSLRFEVAPDVPPHLSGDPPRLQQVINHLVDNALKFTTQGGVDVLLSRAGPSRPGETTVPLRLAVTDTGLGLSTAEQERIFAPFQQIDMSSHRAQGGIGLGLTLCQRLVKLMGGEIGVESVKGVGSTFWFTASLGLPPQPQGGEIAESTSPPVRASTDGGAATPPRLDPSPGPTPGPGPSPGTQAGPDTRLIAPQMGELAGLLADGANRARQVNRALEALVAGTSLQADYARIATAVRELDYPQALDALRDLADRQGWRLP